VIANQRHVLRFVQALLALVLLACVPAVALDEMQPTFLGELSEGIDGETVRDAADDGRPDLEGSAAAVRAASAWQRLSEAVRYAGEPQLGRPALPDGLNRATGPPRG
jgi:hypothetical protein